MSLLIRITYMTVEGSYQPVRLIRTFAVRRRILKNPMILLADSEDFQTAQADLCLRRNI